MDRGDARHLKTLERAHRQIITTEETSFDYIDALMSIGDGLRLIS